MSDNQQPKKKSYTKHLLVSMLVFGISFWIVSYIVGGDPCFDTGDQIVARANELQGNFDTEFIAEYEEFLKDCGHMLDMEQQKKFNPELHKRIEDSN